MEVWRPQREAKVPRTRTSQKEQRQRHTHTRTNTHKHTHTHAYTHLPAFLGLYRKAVERKTIPESTHSAALVTASTIAGVVAIERAHTPKQTAPTPHVTPTACVNHSTDQTQHYQWIGDMCRGCNKWKRSTSKAGSSLCTYHEEMGCSEREGAGDITSRIHILIQCQCLGVL